MLNVTCAECHICWVSLLLSVKYKHFVVSTFAEYRCSECHYAQCHYAECHYAECHYAGVILLSVVMLIVVAPYTHRIDTCAVKQFSLNQCHTGSPYLTYPLTVRSPNLT